MSCARAPSVTKSVAADAAIDANHVAARVPGEKRRIMTPGSLRRRGLSAALLARGVGRPQQTLQLASVPQAAAPGGGAYIAGPRPDVDALQCVNVEVTRALACN